MKYEDRLTCFIDILGFSTLIKESESKIEILEKISTALKYLKKSEESSDWNLKLIEIEESAQKKELKNSKLMTKQMLHVFLILS